MMNDPIPAVIINQSRCKQQCPRATLPPSSADTSTQLLRDSAAPQRRLRAGAGVLAVPLRLHRGLQGAHRGRNRLLAGAAQGQPPPAALRHARRPLARFLHRLRLPGRERRARPPRPAAGRVPALGGGGALHAAAAGGGGGAAAAGAAVARVLQGGGGGGGGVPEAPEALLPHSPGVGGTHDLQERPLLHSRSHSLAEGEGSHQVTFRLRRLEEDRREFEQHRQRYMQGLSAFNSFASRYNSAIGPIVASLERVELGGLTLQADSIRKLIVSEINMFKNIEYDMLNISRQMEAVAAGSQIEDFVVASKDSFNAPIISIYAEGPIASRYEAIDLKMPICGTLLEESLTRIDAGLFYWLLDNKTNSTLRYAIEQLTLKQDGGTGAREETDGEFLTELEATIGSNKSVKMMPVDGQQGQQKLRVEEAYSGCLELSTAIAQLLRDERERRDALLELVEGHISCHHFYRFVAYASLNAYQEQHEQRVTGENFPLLLKLLLQRSIAAKDVFTARLVLSLLFSVAYLTDRPLYCFQFEPIRSLQCWQSRDFWQASIFEATFEVSTLLPAIERSYLKDVYLMRQKNVVFSALATYCHYMVMMGEEVQEVKVVMARFAHIYNLTEEHERDLGKSIAAAIKQLREIEE